MGLFYWGLAQSIRSGGLPTTIPGVAEQLVIPTANGTIIINQSFFNDPNNATAPLIPGFSSSAEVVPGFSNVPNAQMLQLNSAGTVTNSFSYNYLTGAAMCTRFDPTGNKYEDILYANSLVSGFNLYNTNNQITDQVVLNAIGQIVQDNQYNTVTNVINDVVTFSSAGQISNVAFKDASGNTYEQDMYGVGGILDQVIGNHSDGSSFVEQYINLPTGVSKLTTNYTGSNGTGAVTQVIGNKTAGGSFSEASLAFLFNWSA